MPHQIELIAKLEAYDCLQHLDAIVEASDGIMVARGDLGAQVRALVPNECCYHSVGHALCAACMHNVLRVAATQLTQATTRAHTWIGRPGVKRCWLALHACIQVFDVTLMSQGSKRQPGLVMAFCWLLRPLIFGLHLHEDTTQGAPGTESLRLCNHRNQPQVHCLCLQCFCLLCVSLTHFK